MEKMPVFIKIEEYEEVLNLVRLIKRKLNESKETLAKIHELKNEEDHQLELWHTTIDEVERKIDFVDHSLNEPEQY